MADEQQIRVVITGVASDLRRALSDAKGDLGGLSAAIKAVPNKVKVDVAAETTAALERLKTLKSAAKDVPTDINIRADADTGIATAKLRLLRSEARSTEEAIARAQLGSLISGGGGGGGFGSTFAKSFGSGGLPGAGPLALGTAAAPFAAGAVGSAIPVIGSAGAGLLGLGALATSVLGVGGVGLGSMLGVLVQAKTNISAVTTAMNALEKAQANYGASSKQAQQAQVNLNSAMADAGPQASEIAKQLGALGDQWTSLSGPATQALDNIIIPALKVVRDLMPTVAGIAKQSFDAIGTALKPVFAGLSSPAFKKVLADLGDAFARLAGPLIGAFSNLMTAFFHVAVAASPYLIQIAQSFERWTKSFADSLAPGAHLNALMKDLVGQAHSWWELTVALGHVLVSVFSAGADQGKGLVDQLTVLLDKWNAWLNTGAGQAAMHKFFAESLDLLKGVAGVLGAIAPLLANLAVGLIPTMTTLLKPLAQLLSTISGWVNDLSKHLPPVINALPGLAVAVGVLASWKALKALVDATTTAMLGKIGLGGAAGNGAAAKTAGGEGLSTAESVGAGAAGGGLLSVLGRLASSPFVKVGGPLTAFLTTFFSNVQAAGGSAAMAAPAIDKLRQAFSGSSWANIETIKDSLHRFGFELDPKAAASIQKVTDKVAAFQRTVGGLTAVWPSQAQAIIGAFTSIDVRGSAALDQFHLAVQTNMDYIRSHTTSGSEQSRDAIALNFREAAQFMAQNYVAMGVSTKRAMDEINKLLREELSALGVKNIPKNFSTSNLQFLADAPAAGVGGAPGSQLGAFPTRAGGGYIGSPGQQGADNIPIVVGAGEAILNRHQQGPVETALQATYGMGLGELFSNVTRPHYMAGGGFVSTAYGPPWGGIQGGGTTATGIDLQFAPQRYIIAVDPSVIPLHSQVKVWPNPFGYTGTFAAEDTGGAIKGNRIDFYDWKGRADQLAWGRRDVSASIAGHAIAGLAGLSPGSPSIGAPKWAGPGGIAGTIGKRAATIATAGANAFLASLAPASGGAGGGGGLPGAQGPKGLGSFDGLQVADWIIPILNWARSHGWGGRITSGYRPGGSSEHAGTQWPGGAVDVGFNTAITEGTALYDVLTRYPGRPNLLWGGQYISGYTDPRGVTAPGGHDYGHFSGTGHARGGFAGARRFTGGGTAVKHPAASRPPRKAPVRHPKVAKVHVPRAISNALRRLLPANVVHFEQLAGGWAQHQSDLATADDQLTYTQGLAPYPAQPLVALTDADVAALDPHGTLGYETGDQLVNQSGMTVGRFFGPSGISGGSWVPGIDQRNAQISAQLGNLYGQQGALGKAAGYYGSAIDVEGKAKREREKRRARVLAFLKVQVAHAKAIQRELAAISTGNLRQNLARALSRQAVGRRLSSLQGQKRTVAEELRSERASQAALIPLDKDPTHTNALQAQLDQLNQSIAVEQDLSRSSTSSLSVSTARSALLKNSLTGRLKAYATVDTNLGGRPYDVGTGGLIGILQKQIDAIQGSYQQDAQAKGALSSPAQTISNAIAAYLAERTGLGGTSAIQVRTPTVATAPDQSALNALLTQQLQSTRQDLATSQAQFGVLSGFAPLLQGRLVGTFQSGIDFVPATGLAMVHKGETILPDPSGPQGNRASATVHTAQGPIEIVIVMANNEEPLMKIVSAQMNQKALRIVSDHSGQRARLMAGVRRLP